MNNSSYAYHNPFKPGLSSGTITTLRHFLWCIQQQRGEESSLLGSSADGQDPEE